MKTIYQLQQIADRLRAVTEVNSISPEDTFGLQADVLEYLADMEQNAEGLGIHKVYASYAAMVADASAPVGSNGKALRFGQLVVIYDSNNTTQAESGNVYAWQKGNTGTAAWLLMGNLGSMHTLQSQIDSLLSSLADEENARTSADNEIKKELAAQFKSENISTRYVNTAFSFATGKAISGTTKKFINYGGFRVTNAIKINKGETIYVDETITGVYNVGSIGILKKKDLPLTEETVFSKLVGRNSSYTATEDDEYFVAALNMDTDPILELTTITDDNISCVELKNDISVLTPLLSNKSWLIGL